MPPSPPTAADRWRTRTLFAGAATLLVVLCMAPFNPRHGCGGPLWGPPILVFEFLHNAGEALALFGPRGDCRTDLLLQFAIVNTLDYAFMVTYGSLLVCGLMTTHAHAPQALPRSLRNFAVACAVLAPLSDAVENMHLLQFQSPEQTNFAFTALRAAASTKFVLLGVVSAVLAFAQLRMFATHKWRALAHAFGLPLVLLGLALPRTFLRVMSAPFMLSWVALLVWAIARKPSRATAE